jgi:membrane associated rhomboid family serine protease
MASYAVLFPFRRLFVFFGLIPIAAPAIVVIFGLALIQLLYAVAMPFSLIAYIAHIGGFIAGLIITLIYRAGLRRYYYV